MRNKKGQFVTGHKELVTHGRAKTREYNTWNHMISRCYNKNDGAYKYYGGRGIGVTNKWRTFEGFWADMGDSYYKSATLDRINNDLNYSKKNCRWTSQLEQARNKRTTLRVFYRGKNRVLTELCKELDVEYMMVYLRIKRYKWEVEKAISTPSRQKQL